MAAFTLTDESAAPEEMKTATRIALNGVKAAPDVYNWMQSIFP